MNNNVFGAISYGLYAIGTKTPDGRANASVVNALIQVTTEPPCVCVCVNHVNFTNECLKNDGLFTVSVFNENATLIQIGGLGFKSGRDFDKLDGRKYRLDSDGLPILEENICTNFKCKVISSSETTTHTLFVAEVVETSDEELNGKPITYEYYRTVVKGKASKNAPHL